MGDCDQGGVLKSRVQTIEIAEWAKRDLASVKQQQPRHILAQYAKMNCLMVKSPFSITCNVIISQGFCSFGRPKFQDFP